MSTKILLVQFRHDISEQHEQECFEEALLQHSVKWIYVNGIDGNLAPYLLDTVDAVIFGGSGELGLTKDHDTPWLSKVLAFIDEVHAHNKPILGVCFGFQLLSISQGGSVVHDPQQVEVGTFPVTLQESSISDPLFKNIPKIFDAQLGHKHVVSQLNGTLEYLAESERVFPQAYRVKGKDAWGVLFHPEMNRSRMKGRLSMFPDYLPEDVDPDQLFTDTPYAEKVLHNFINFVINRD